jgi:cystathionine beta-lyase/cystathionine gamma-synthase
MANKIDTLAVHAGAKVCPSDTQSKVSPIFASSVWSFDSLEQIDDVYEQRAPGYVYSRISNPGVEQLEQSVALLEGAEAAAAYSSGMAAIAMALLAELKAGDHVVAHQVLYGGTYTLLTNEMGRFGVETSFIDFTDMAAVHAAMRPNTKVLYVETICNPLMEVIDIPAVAELANKTGAKVYVDNTFASPVHFQPLVAGADVVIHSATKYLNGHSDITGGVVAANREFIDRVKKIGTTYGPTLSPFDAWLVLRGIKTLAVRMERHSANAMKLAEFLSAHPTVTQVHYPGLPNSKTYAAAQKLLVGGCGGMLSFAVTGGMEAARAVIDGLQLTELVPSLAGPSTTVSHPGKTSHRAIPVDDRQAYGVGDDLIRVSVGIESIDDIIADFAQVLARLG